MKKFLTAAASLILSAAMLTACGSAPAAAAATTAAATTTAATAPAAALPETEEPRNFKVAIVQQLDHASLDEICAAIEAELDRRGIEEGISITCDVYSGQNDATVLNQIGAQVISDKVDAIIPIATLAATTMTTAAEDTGTPIIYAAISDPESAGLTGLPNVTGTSDALNTQFILDMMLAVQPNIETVGLLYSNSEANSAVPIAQAKEYLDAKGIAYIEKTGNSADEVLTAANALVGRVQAVFTPTDNAVMACEGAVAEIFAEAGIPHYTGADSFVYEGAFATSGVNYTDLGTYTADMAIDILLGGDIPEYHVMDGGIITVNSITADVLGIDYSVYMDMASTIVELSGD